MRGIRKCSFWLVSLLVIMGMVAGACAPVPAVVPAPTSTAMPVPATPVLAATAAPTEAPAAAPAAAGNVNAFGVQLPADAAPPEQQFIRIIATTGTTIDFPVSVYNRPAPPWQTLSTPLTQINKNFETVPAAAESWEVSADGLTWTFHLDKNLKWSDGVPVTAKDYEFTFQYEADPKHAWDFAWFWGYSCNPKNWSKVVAGELPLTELGVKAVDDYTLTITTEKPAPFMPATLIFSRPLAKHAFDKYGEYYNNDPKTAVSSEPWILQEWTKDQRIVLGPNTNYTGKQKPYIERLIFELGDINRQFDSYQADETDWANTFSVAAIDTINADPKLKTQYHPGYGDFRTDYLGFDTAHPPFDKLKVRQAFSHVIDRDAIISKIVKTQGFAAYGMLMPGFPDSANDEIKGIQNYDPALGKQLLAEAGYPDGKGFPKLEMWVRQTDPELIQSIAAATAAMIHDQLGIEVQVVTKDVKVYTDALNAHQMQLYYATYGMDYFDASNLLSIWRSGGRHTWKNDQFDKLFDEAGPLLDMQQRSTMYKEAQKILVEDVGAVFLWHRTPGDLYKPYIVGADVAQPDRYGVTACHWPCFESIGTAIYTTYISKDVNPNRKP